jgi:parallel beta-helix repeat protein
VNEQTGAVMLDAADVEAIPAAEKGTAGGVATLGTDGKVTPAQLPADAVTSVNNLTGNVVLDAESVGALTPEQASSLYSTKDSLAFNAKEHGAVADGTTDDQPVIQNLLNSAPAGSTVILPPGAYATGTPIVVPPGKTLRGLRTNLMGVVGLYDPQVCIKPLPTFTGVAAIRFLDQAEGGYTTISGEQRVLDLMLDGVNVAAGVDGIQAKGNVQNVALRDVTIARFPNSGIYCGLGGDNIAPYSWRMHRVMLDNNHAHGMYGDRMVDLTAVDCQAIGNWSNGFMFGNSANSQLIGCRAEWNGNHGFYLTGDWGLGAGAGGALLSGCSTDRNGFHGVFIDVVGTNAPLVISGLMTRRDGRNGGAGGGGYAGVAALNSSMPLIIGDWTNFPGTDDDGTQANSPEYGGSFANCTHVQINNAYLHAATEALHDGGGNQTLRLGANVFYGVGTTAEVTRTLAPESNAVLASRVGAANGVASLDAASKIPAGQIPSLPASQIGSGTFAATRIPDLSGTYVATTSKGVANGVASLGANGLIPASQLPSSPEGSLRVFSVLDYGAVGNGVADDLAAFEAALTAAYDAGGGVVWVPGGRTYGISNYMHILSNTTIMAYGATIKGIANRGLAKLYKESDTTLTGYNGHSRIQIYGGIWDVNASDGSSGTVTAVVDAFLMGHNRNVIFRDIIVRNVSGAHAIDVTACQGVQVLGCRFEGFKDNTPDQSSGFREAIQLDFAISGSGINGSFDGTPSKDILIEGCYFGPSDRLGGFGRAIGSHSSASATSWCENIQILGNRIEATVQGGIRAYAWKGAVIENNLISGTGSAGIIVTGPDPAVTGYALACQDIAIRGNTVGPSGGSSPIRVEGFATARPIGVSISGNRISGSGSTGIYVSQAAAPLVTGNQVNACTTSSIYVINCSEPSVTDNQSNDSGGTALGIDTCAGGFVSTNVVNGSSGHGILVSGGSHISVSTNRVVAAAGSGIRATSNTVRPRIIGNTILRGGIAATWGLDVTASATDALVLNNDLTGSSWPNNPTTSATTAYNLVGTRQILDWTGVVGVTVPGQNLVS